MAKRPLPEINASSMADIAFLLLIFFLITTTMDTDSGLGRVLPPMEKSEDIQVNERNIFVVLVNRNNQLLVEGELMNIRNLKEAAKEFIKNENDKENLPKRSLVDVPYFGKVMVTKGHVISLQNDRGTNYRTYIAVHNQLAQAYRELRDELALSKWGKTFEDLDEEKKDAIEMIYKNTISEAEPKNIGGGKS